MNPFELIIFDVDGTLIDRDTEEFLPGVVDWFNEHRCEYEFAFCTNQGGVGLRYWMEQGGFGEPEKYPTEKEVRRKVHKITETLLPEGEDCWTFSIYWCFAYMSKSSGKIAPVPPDVKDICEWSLAFRKPAPGMLFRAMTVSEVTPRQTLMVGDRDEDEQAAKAAGVMFCHADEFFDR